MQIRNSIYFALIMALVMNSFVAISAPLKQSVADQKIENFNKRKNLFEKYCLTKDEKINSIIEDVNGNRIDCLSEAKALKELDTELRNVSSGDIAGTLGGSCKYLEDPGNEQLDKLSKDTMDAANSMSCTKDEAQADERSCVKDAGCNALRSLMTFTGVSGAKNALNSILGKVNNDKSSQNSCTDSTKSDCLTELVAGILKDIWSNVEGAWDLLKMGGNWAKDKVVSGWNHLFQAEDKTSDSALLASQQSESWIKSFINSPGESLKKMGEGLYNMIADGIKDSFMCAKWEGQPHLSKCLTPETQAWSCSSCDQKINSICGVAGFAAGEIAVAYLTGGALNLGKAAIKTVGVAKAVAKISESLPKFSKMKNLAKAVGSKISRLSDKTMSAIDKALKNKVVAGTVGAVKVVSWPLREYAKLMDKALELGLKHGEFSSAKLGVKTASNLDRTSKDMYQVAAGKSAKEITANKDEILKVSASLSDSQRVEAASTVVGRDLTKPQEKAILEAHNIGADAGHGYGTYTQSELRKKIESLDAAGFNKEEINKIMRTGITGDFRSEYSANEALAKSKIEKNSSAPVSAEEKLHSEFIDAAQSGMNRAISEKRLGDYEKIQDKLLIQAKEYSVDRKIEAINKTVRPDMSAEQASALNKALESGDASKLKEAGFTADNISKIEKTITKPEATRIQKLYEAAASKSGKEITANKDAILKISAGLSDSQRVEAASGIIGKKLTAAEEKAVIDAHKVGEGHGYGTYTAAELKEKLRILKEAGIDGEKADKLMRTGITGGEELSQVERMKQMAAGGMSKEEILKVFKEESATKGATTKAPNEEMDLDFSHITAPVVAPAKKESVVHAGVVKENSTIKIDGQEIAIGGELGRGSAGVVYSAGNNEIIKLPLDPRNLRDIHLEVQNASKLTEAGIPNVPILNIPKDGSMPSFLRKPKLNRMEDLDGEAVKHMNTGEYAGTYTPEQKESLRNIYNRMETYNKGKPEQAQLILDLNPANLYWDQKQKQFLLIEGAPPTAGQAISKRWLGPEGRERFEERYGISLKETP